MHKKLITACLAIAVFAAFVVAPSASAVQIGETNEKHEFTALKANSGVKITGTQLGASRMTDKNGGILVECTKGTMTGELTENGANVITGDITSASFTNNTGGACPSIVGTSVVTTKIEDKGPPVVQTGVPWCLSTIKATDTFEVRGGNCNEAARNLIFILDNSVAGECEYSKASVTGTFRTDVKETEDAILTVTKNGAFVLIRGGAFCPKEGFLDMEFTLETDESPFAPLYIK